MRKSIKRMIVSFMAIIMVTSMLFATLIEVGASGTDGGSTTWVAGDFDENGVVNMQDVVHFMGWVNFSYVPGLYPMNYKGSKDFNKDGKIDMQDVVYFMGWVNFSYVPGLYDIDWGSLAFTSNGDGTCYVSGIGTYTDTALIIPSVSPDGDAVKGISEGAFANCTSLTSIEIPASVTNIGKGAFSGCGSLTSIVVAEGNTVYHSAGNCLIETAGKKLIAGCKNSTIPTDGSVTSIGERAFYGYSSLTSIEIPASVTSIGAYAFYGCSALEKIIFDGFESDWNAVSKGENWDSGVGAYNLVLNEEWTHLY